MAALLVKSMATQEVVSTMEVTGSARQAARAFKGLLLKVDREKFFVDDSAVEALYGDAYIEAM